jgi:hypothetical protein
MIVFFFLAGLDSQSECDSGHESLLEFREDA